MEEPRTWQKPSKGRYKQNRRKTAFTEEWIRVCHKITQSGGNEN